jgi:hypothetical protein
VSAVSSDEQAWRVTFARLLLCVTLIFHLVVFARMTLRRPTHYSLQALAPSVALLLSTFFAGIAIVRLRVSAYIALVVASLLSIRLMLETVLYMKLLRAALAGPAYWRAEVGALIAIAIYFLTVLALLIVWPLRSSHIAAPPGRRSYPG